MKIVVISLPQARERRRSAARQLGERGITFEFFDAVTASDVRQIDGIEGCNKADWLLNTGRRATAAEIACFASHRTLWQHCAKLRTPLLVLEDDFRVIDGFESAIRQAAGMIDEFGFIRLQYARRARFRNIRTCGDFRLVRYTKAPYSTMCYAISPAVAKRFLALTRVIDAPVDGFVTRYWEHGTALFGLLPYTITESSLCTRSFIPGRRKAVKDIATAAKRSLRKCKWSVQRWRFNRSCATGTAGSAS